MAQAIATTRNYDYIDELEGMALLDAQAQKHLQMSGAEFLRLFAEGKLPDPDRAEVVRVSLLLRSDRQR